MLKQGLLAKRDLADAIKISTENSMSIHAVSWLQNMERHLNVPPYFYSKYAS